MFVTKKTYQEAQDRIGALEKELEEKNVHLLLQQSENKHFKQDFQNLQGDYSALQNQLEEMSTTIDNLEVLKRQVSSFEAKVEDNKLEILALESQINEKTTHLNFLKEKIQEDETFLNKVTNERTQTSLELSNLIEEVNRTAEDRYLKATEIERGLIEELDQKLEFQKEQVKQHQNDLVELEEQLINKEKVLHNYRELKESFVMARDERNFQSVAFYKKDFPFTTTEKFKDELNDNYQKQREMIKQKRVVIEGTSWTVNGSLREGRKMTDLNIKGMIRSYNIECDNAIASLKYANFDTVESRMDKSLASINKLNAKNALVICDEYHQLKIEELKLVYELKLFEQEEKEKLRVLREEERERRKVEREIKEKTVEYNKHQKEVEKELSALHKQNIEANEDDSAVLNRINELYDSLELIEKKREELEYIHLVGKSGYVYIISNIGAFGKDVYKIGMTRRLEPADRIRELSGAAVPFEYDVHAMILTDDAPHLESHLHAAFNTDRVNLVNNRKEFFNVKLEQIKQEVFSIVGKNVVFEDEPTGKNYYESLAIKNALTNQNSDYVGLVLLN
ncbi:DUF4041 domain-containing protein [Planococcus kocurii]|uniref:Bacteriophage T5 Orf172 DNA-binding domain-containing protein n=1 Tax=Planococcus faecalis TaxID=1598147 RepID=A0ABM6ITA4_9BACL|nr:MULTISPECIES: DUF4041 domain-containing protein [Planococcus]AQU79572.1 hypothetical protein AJGP001_10010 [Planococcus faecalis]KAA0958139.1 DUF4041 domain-containing protein [Planococcus sp. ANT_H30]